MNYTQLLALFVLLVCSIFSVDAKCWTDECCKNYCTKHVCGSEGNYAGHRPTSGYMSGLTCVCTYSPASPKCSR